MSDVWWPAGPASDGRCASTGDLRQAAGKVAAPIPGATPLVRPHATGLESNSCSRGYIMNHSRRALCTLAAVLALCLVAGRAWSAQRDSDKKPSLSLKADAAGRVLALAGARHRRRARRRRRPRRSSTAPASSGTGVTAPCRKAPKTATRIRRARARSGAASRRSTSTARPAPTRSTFRLKQKDKTIASLPAAPTCRCVVASATNLAVEVPTSRSPVHGGTAQPCPRAPARRPAPPRRLVCVRGRGPVRRRRTACCTTRPRPATRRR